MYGGEKRRRNNSPRSTHALIVAYVALLLCIIGFVCKCKCQGSWNILNIKYTANKKISLFVEAQLRSLKFYNQFHYYEYKGGINYKATQDLILTLAAGHYDTYKEGGNFVLPKNSNEFRVWPQITLNQSIGKIKIEQRYRAELRFTNNGYKNRVRYRLGLSYPFGKDKKGFKPFQINVNDELFFTNNEPFFQRNRLWTSFNYRFSKQFYVQTGYIYQTDYKVNDETGKDFLQIGFYLEL